MGSNKVLAERIINFIHDREAETFELLALEVFAHQFELNLPYHRFCRELGVSPTNVSSWTEIPPVSTEAFKEVKLTCGQPQNTFLTTGTTRGTENRGYHLLSRPDVYRASALRNFADYVLPEGGKYPIFVLAPSLKQAPDSSLAQMIDWIATEYGSSVGYYLNQGKVAARSLYENLSAASVEGRPVLLLALTRALVELAQLWRGRVQGSLALTKVTLPPGSRIMDTGGSKGLGREVSREEILDIAWTMLGIDKHLVVNEYGMTEMCSQCYDDILTAEPGPQKTPGHKTAPHWVRTRVVNPLSLREVGEGEWGLLLHFDLANVESVSALLTDDIGSRHGTAFRMERRAAGAQIRGCSLAIESS